jgi:hypothetical protein
LLHELWVPDAITKNGAELVVIPAGILQDPALPHDSNTKRWDGIHFDRKQGKMKQTNKGTKLRVEIGRGKGGTS